MRRGWRQCAVALAALPLLGACGGDADGGAGAGFVAVDAAGEERTIDDVRGTTTLLAGWATWCVPCERELPELEAALPELRAAGIRVVAVNVDGPSVGDEVVRDMIERLAPSIEWWRDEDGTLLGAYGGFLMPFSALVDEAGHPIRTWNGALDPADVVPSLTD